MRKKLNQKIILASQSPRREILLKNIGLKFDIYPAQINESINNNKSAVWNARYLAEQKAHWVAREINNPNYLIISGDTIVLLGKKILGKPNTKKEALEMLSQLSGKKHRVITAICIIKGKEKLVGHVITEVIFQKLTNSIIRNYVSSGEPMDKAGGYAIQGLGSLLIKKIHGDYFNVMGLPLVKLSGLLSKFGIRLI